MINSTQLIENCNSIHVLSWKGEKSSSMARRRLSSPPQMCFLSANFLLPTDQVLRQEGDNSGRPSPSVHKDITCQPLFDTLGLLFLSVSVLCYIRSIELLVVAYECFKSKCSTQKVVWKSSSNCLETRTRSVFSDLFEGE